MARKLMTMLVMIVILLPMMTGCQPSSESPGETSPTASVEGNQVGNLAPDFQVQNLDGENVSLSELRGKPVMLNFWATWCPPCVSEMSYIQQIYKEWSDKGLVLLTIDVGESSARVKEFLQAYNLSLPTLLDTERRVAQKYSIKYYPTTFFIDKNGIIQEKKIGAFQNKEEIERYLGKIIP